jgi:hypothetical protein
MPLEELRLLGVGAKARDDQQVDPARRAAAAIRS